MYQFFLEYMLTPLLVVLLFLQVSHYLYIEGGKAKHRKIIMGREQAHGESLENYYYGSSSMDIPNRLTGQFFGAVSIFGVSVYLIALIIHHFDFSFAKLNSIDTLMKHAVWDGDITFPRIVVAEVITLLGTMLFVFLAEKHTLSYYKEKGYGVDETTPMGALSDGAKRILKEKELLSSTDLYRWKTFSIQYEDHRIAQLTQINAEFNRYLELEGKFNRLMYLNKETEEMSELKEQMEGKLSQIKKMVGALDVWTDYVFVAPDEKPEDIFTESRKVEFAQMEDSYSLPTEIHELNKIIHNPNLPEPLRVEATVLLQEISSEQVELKKKQNQEQAIQDAEITIETIRRMKAAKA